MAKRRSGAGLTDVARKAGVDASTASRVLNRDLAHRVRDETRQRVLDAARELGYRPNLIAQGLRTSRTFTLGVIVPQLDNPVFPQIIEGAEVGARGQGYTLIISHIGEQGRGDTALESRPWMNHVDGLLVAALDVDRPTVDTLDAIGAPYVILNQYAEYIRNFVVLDSLAAAELAVDHLLHLGHRRIAHVAGRQGGYNSELRLRGYRNALARAGIEYDPALVVTAGFTQAGGKAAISEILRAQSPPPSAVFAATILSAAGAMAGLREAGLTIPGDVSVTALHDGALAEALYPPLTTVRMPLEFMGRCAAEGLIDVIEGRAGGVRLTLPPDCLVERGSTATPR